MKLYLIMGTDWQFKQGERSSHTPVARVFPLYSSQGIVRGFLDPTLGLLRPVRRDFHKHIYLALRLYT